jgi:biopolymer transport protein ExbD
MARAKKIKRSGGVFSEINITPLTDIFLVLLIIFMVTTAVTIESAAHVDLPKGQPTTPQEKPKGVVITYTADHQIFVAGQNVTEAQLPAALQVALANSPDKIVIFQGDPKVILGDMVRILDIAKTAGAAAIAIAVAQLPPGGVPAGGGPGGG